MDKPYKCELGKKWWTVYYGKVLLTAAHCHYNMNGGDSIEYTAEKQDGTFVVIDETDLSVAAKDLNEMQAEIYRLTEARIPTDAEKAEFWQSTNEAYEKLKDDKPELVGCDRCGGIGRSPSGSYLMRCIHCGGTGKLEINSNELEPTEPLVFEIPDEDSAICTECFGLGRVSDTWIENDQLKCNSLDWEPHTRTCLHCNGTGVEPVSEKSGFPNCYFGRNRSVFCDICKHEEACIKEGVLNG